MGVGSVFLSMDYASVEEHLNKLIENGVLAITAGKNAVRLLPPLVISKEEMDEALAVMAKVF